MKRRSYLPNTTTVDFEFDLEREDENSIANIELEVSYDNDSYEIDNFKSDIELTGEEEAMIQDYFDKNYNDLVKSEEEEREYYFDCY